MLRISFVMLGLREYRTGGYYFNFRMLDALKSAGHDVDAIHFQTVPEHVRGSRVRGSFYVLKRVIDFDPNLVIISKSYSFVLPLRFLIPVMGYPMLYLVHHLEWHDRDEKPSALRKLVIRLLVSGAKRVWTNSRSTADDVVSLGIPERKTAVIPPGFERFKLKGQRDSTIGILCVGTVCPRKDQLTLVRACSMLGDREFHLFVLGDETTDRIYAQQVRAEAEALGRKVTFAGHLSRDELHGMYNRAHILANLSRWEGYGIAVAEGMWAGLPVVAANAGAVPEIVTHGVNGYLIPAGDAETCALYLGNLIDDEKLRDEMSHESRERAEKLFSWNDTGREFVKLAEEVAGRKIRWNKSGR